MIVFDATKQAHALQHGGAMVHSSKKLGLGLVDFGLKKVVVRRRRTLDHSIKTLWYLVEYMQWEEALD